MLGRESIPLLAEEGWREAPGWSVRRNRGRAGLTASLDGCALSGLRGLRPPSAPLRWLRNIFLMAQPPLLICCAEGRQSVSLEHKKKAQKAKDDSLASALFWLASATSSDRSAGSCSRSFRPAFAGVHLSFRGARRAFRSAGLYFQASRRL
jgi:hypothetical protein